MSTPSGWVIAGRYRVLERVGSGGMADVLRAHDELLDRDVAVKVFRTVVTAPDGTADTAKGVERQRAELAALARLNHPNLTTLYDGSIVGQQGPAYLVMELIDGPSLADALGDGPLPEAQVRTIGAQIGDALDYVHRAGMVHRDVKPANILLGRDRAHPDDGLRARLTDFGIVRLVGNEPLTRADMTLGSASYLAPEQARGSAVGPPADVYALGLTLLEALTGHRTFDGPAVEAVVARLSADPEIPANLPAPWPGLLRAMTARDPAARPTAAGAAAALRGTGSVTVPLRSMPAGDYGTAMLPAAAPVLPAAGRTLGAGGAGAGGRPPSTPTGSSTAQRAAEPRRHWSASLIVAGVLVLALIVAGVALLLANSDSGNGGGTPATSTSTTVSRTASRTPSSSNTPTRTHSSTPSRSSSSPTSSASSPSTSTSPTSSSSSSSPTATRTSTTPTTSTSSASATATSTRTSSGAGAVVISPSSSATTSSN